MPDRLEINLLQRAKGNLYMKVTGGQKIISSLFFISKRGYQLKANGYIKVTGGSRYFVMMHGKEIMNKPCNW